LSALQPGEEADRSPRSYHFISLAARGVVPEPGSLSAARAVELVRALACGSALDCGIAAEGAKLASAFGAAAAALSCACVCAMAGAVAAIKVNAAIIMRGLIFELLISGSLIHAIERHRPGTSIARCVRPRPQASIDILHE